MSLKIHISYYWLLCAPQGSGHGFCACGQYPFRTIGLADASGAYPETALDTAVSSRGIPLSLSLTSSSAHLLLSTLISHRAWPLQCKYSHLPILFQLTFLQLLVDTNGCNNHISCPTHQLLPYWSLSFAPQIHPPTVPTTSVITVNNPITQAISNDLLILFRQQRGNTTMGFGAVGWGVDTMRPSLWYVLQYLVHVIP